MTDRETQLARALDDLLRATRKSGGYTPRVYLARLRARRAIREAQPSHRADVGLTPTVQVEGP